MYEYCIVCSNRKQCKTERTKCDDGKDFVESLEYMTYLNMGFYPWVDKQKIFDKVSEYRLEQTLDKPEIKLYYPIESLELSTKAHNGLIRGISLKYYHEKKNADALTLRDVVALESKEIKEFHAVGKKCFNEIVDAVHNMGLKLKGEN